VSKPHAYFTAQSGLENFPSAPVFLREEESRLIAGYQSKWREESLSWSELDSAVTTECQQVIDISDAALAASPDNSSRALRIRDFLNYNAYRELFLRTESLTLTRGDGHDLGISDLLKMG